MTVRSIAPRAARGLRSVLRGSGTCAPRSSPRARCTRGRRGNRSGLWRPVRRLRRRHRSVGVGRARRRAAMARSRDGSPPSAGHPLGDELHVARQHGMPSIGRGDLPQPPAQDGERILLRPQHRGRVATGIFTWNVPTTRRHGPRFFRLASALAQQRPRAPSRGRSRTATGARRRRTLAPCDRGWQVDREQAREVFPGLRRGSECS